jgi:hypothetical protein
MSVWKKIIFVNAIKYRMKSESKTADVIIADYTKLTDTEKTEILQAINS